MDFNHSPAEILRALLIQLELGVDPETSTEDWPVFVMAIPDTEAICDSALSVSDTAGILDGRLMTGRTIDHPGWQIRARSIRYTDGHRRLSKIANRLDYVRLDEVTLTDGTTDTTYQIANVSRKGNVIPLGQDPNDSKRRNAFTLNGILTVKPINVVVHSA